jgi:predicted RNase H-like nuclease (RuvC/YqgF family)
MNQMAKEMTAVATIIGLTAGGLSYFVTSDQFETYKQQDKTEKQDIKRQILEERLERYNAEIRVLEVKPEDMRDNWENQYIQQKRDLRDSTLRQMERIK